VGSFTAALLEQVQSGERVRLRSPPAGAGGEGASAIARTEDTTSKPVLRAPEEERAEERRYFLAGGADVLESVAIIRGLPS
jgi:hypothetical protein